MYNKIIEKLDEEITRCEEVGTTDDQGVYDAYMNRVQGLLFARRVVYGHQQVALRGLKVAERE